MLVPPGLTPARHLLCDLRQNSELLSVRNHLTCQSGDGPVLLVGSIWAVGSHVGVSASCGLTPGRCHSRTRPTASTPGRGEPLAAPLTSFCGLKLGHPGASVSQLRGLKGVSAFYLLTRGP